MTFKQINVFKWIEVILCFLLVASSIYCAWIHETETAIYLLIWSIFLKLDRPIFQ